MENLIYNSISNWVLGNKYYIIYKNNNVSRYGLEANEQYREYLAVS